MAEIHSKQFAIDRYRVSAFKCFDEIELRFGALTLFTGYNGGGKSTIIQSLLLLAQELSLGQDRDFVGLNGPLIRLGSAGEVVNEFSEKETSFTVSGAGGQYSWAFLPKAGDRFLSTAKTTTKSGVPDILNRVISQIQFIGAVRKALGGSSPYREKSIWDHCDVGSSGEYASYWYNKFADDEVPKSKLPSDQMASTFRKQVDYWLGYLFPGAQANVQHIEKLCQFLLEFRLTESGNWQQPINIGYGLSYCFPIIVALLGASEKQLVIIDSPEAHLHPSAQSKMGELLAHFANAGVQIIVETHSDHLLNGVRLAVKRSTLAADTLEMYFFSGASVEDHGVINPRIDIDGNIDDWPMGFFDQSELDLMKLSGWE